MKYNYDKKLMKQFSVGPFLGQVKLREKMIAQAPDTPPVSVFNANILAKSLHPHAQYAVISKVEVISSAAQTRNCVPSCGGSAAWMRCARGCASVYDIYCSF